MAVSQTPRLGITRWSAGSDPFGRGQLDGDHSKLEDLVAVDLQGLRSARPAAGVRGRYYFATNEGFVYRDDGTGWSLVGHSIGGVAPTGSSPGDTSAEGSSNVAARADHKHSRETHGAAQHTEYGRLDGATFTGTLQFTANALLRIRRYSEQVNAPVSAPTTVLDVTQGMVHSIVLSQNTTLTVTGVDAAGSSASSLTVILIQDSTGGRTVTWPVGIKWPDGLVPTLTTTANAVNVLTLLSPDGGTTWYGYLAGRNMS